MERLIHSQGGGVGTGVYVAGIVGGKHIDARGEVRSRMGSLRFVYVLTVMHILS